MTIAVIMLFFGGIIYLAWKYWQARLAIGAVLGFIGLMVIAGGGSGTFATVLLVSGILLAASGWLTRKLPLARR